MAHGITLNPPHSQCRADMTVSILRVKFDFMNSQALVNVRVPGGQRKARGWRRWYGVSLDLWVHQRRTRSDDHSEGADMGDFLAKTISRPWMKMKGEADGCYLGGGEPRSMGSMRASLAWLGEFRRTYDVNQAYGGSLRISFWTLIEVLLQVLIIIQFCNVKVHVRFFVE